jgi:hypothetical protein
MGSGLVILKENQSGNSKIVEEYRALKVLPNVKWHLKKNKLRFKQHF